MELTQVDVIILSFCSGPANFEMNINCVDSLLLSEEEIEFNVRIIESNKNFHKLGYRYPEPIEVICPEEEFNFNHFLNIGLNATHNKYFAFCNNDLLFQEHWCSNMLKVRENNHDIESTSPIDPTKESWSSAYEVGYGIRREFKGWCFMVDRDVFEITGPFDERFDFYYQDDDFAMTLRKHDILHAVVPSSHVVHFAGQSAKDREAFNFEKRSQRDSFIYHQKWGSQRSLAYKIRLIRGLKLLGLGSLAKHILISK